MLLKKSKLKIIGSVLIIVFLGLSAFKPIEPSLKVGLLKYSGGGDWYANLETSLRNLVTFCNQNLGTTISTDQIVVDVASPDLSNFAFVHMTGHGNVIFNAQETQNLRRYLIGGGFLHISDNFGMDKFVRREIKKVFPELEFVELPFNHPIYHQKYDFPNGLPKVHEHDGTAPVGYGLIYNGRMVCFYDYECDLGDGWEDFEVHRDSPEVHQRALKMGANMIQYVFSN